MSEDIAEPEYEGSVIWGAIWVGLILAAIVGCVYELVKWLW